MADAPPVTAPSGVRWYVSAPGYGKTTRALRDARGMIGALRYPLLVIDSASADQLAGVPHADSVRETIERVWAGGLHTAFVPESADQVEALLAAAFAAGHAILLVDETAFWLTSRRGTSSWLLRLMRSHRHARLWLLLTTQHFSGDLPQEAHACAPELLVGRVTSPTALDVLERRYGMDPRQVARLPVGTFLPGHLALDRALAEESDGGVTGGDDAPEDPPSPVTSDADSPPDVDPPPESEK